MTWLSVQSDEHRVGGPGSNLEELGEAVEPLPTKPLRRIPEPSRGLGPLGRAQ